MACSIHLEWWALCLIAGERFPQSKTFQINLFVFHANVFVLWLNVFVNASLPKKRAKHIMKQSSKRNIELEKGEGEGIVNRNIDK